MVGVRSSCLLIPTQLLSLVRLLLLVWRLILMLAEPQAAFVVGVAFNADPCTAFVGHPCAAFVSRQCSKGHKKLHSFFQCCSGAQEAI